MIKIACQTGDDIELEFDTLLSSDLSHMKLHRAIFTKQQLTASMFIGADLRGALLDGCDMRNCDFRDALMMNALMVQADLRGAVLRNASLVGAVLDDADLREADLTGVDVAFANFKKTDVRGAIFLCKRLDEAELSDLVYDEHTVFPNGFILPQ